ncbi:putative 2-hydroxyacyl-CoA lyase [Schizosaccharomyces pombe]
MSISFSELVAKTLLDLEVKVVFGIVGIPVIEICEAIQASGIRFVGFRNEQSAAYAATAYGYLTQRPGVCVVVGGPGVVHAMAGVFNSKTNRWPLLLLAGSSETFQQNCGAFQELDQVSYLSPHTKLAVRPPSPKMVVDSIRRAYRVSMTGTPGTCYVDLPANYIESTVDDFPKDPLPPIPSSPKCAPDPTQLQKAAYYLKNAKAPLLVVGKGAAYACAEKQLLEFVEHTGIPFLPSPMGKGLLPESHSLNVSSARSAALRNADVVLLAGARLNWIFQYGLPPKWSPNAKFIQIDTNAETLGNNAADLDLAIWADVGLTIDCLFKLVQTWKYSVGISTPYLRTLNETRSKNEKKALESRKPSIPLQMNYALYVVNEELQSLSLKSKRNITWVSEGANTMDRGRQLLEVTHPRGRLDAGTMSTMGVGMGYAIASAFAHSSDKIVVVEGDSAFGFSAMELETAIRNQLDLLVIVINNNGVYHGLDTDAYETLRDKHQLPTTALGTSIRYDQICEACGGKGFFVKNEEDLRSSLRKAWQTSSVSLINVMVDPEAARKLTFAWMSSTKVKPKL